jgi:hypothetical protein
VLEDRGRYTSDTTATGTLRVRLRLTLRGAFVNCRTPRIRWTATLQLPDLAVGLDEGGHFVMRNGGRADSSAFELRVTLADGATNATQVPGLRAGRSLTLTAPCAAGSTLTADAASQVAEAREDNNTGQCNAERWSDAAGASGQEIALDLLHRVGGQARGRGVVAHALGRRRGVDAVRGQAVRRPHDVRVLRLDVRELVGPDLAGHFGGGVDLGLRHVAKGTLDQESRHGGQYANSLTRAEDQAGANRAVKWRSTGGSSTIR